MANSNKVPSPVLPLPPLEYDPQYFNNLIRLLNYYIEQKDNPGQMRGSKIELSDGTPDPAVSINSSAVVFKALPTSATGLVSGQLWRDGTTVKIIP